MFKVRNPPDDPGIRRGANGRFVPAAPPQVVSEAVTSGTETVQLIHDKYSSPEHSTPGARRGIGEEKPWPPAQAPAKLPFKVRS